MKLKFYEEADNDLIDLYTITDDQLRFTNSPKKSVALAEKDTDRYCILAIQENSLVTFFVLHQNEGVAPYSSNKRAILIRSFSTDFHHQGKGYAKKALQLLPKFVQANFPNINELVLSVNIQNIAAQKLYEKCGFIDEGVRVMGSKGELIVMNYPLEEK